MRAAGTRAQRTARVAIAAVFYAAALALAFDVVASALEAARGYDAVVAFQSAGEKTDSLVKDWLGRLSFGLYAGGEQKAAAIEAVTAAADNAARRSAISSVVLAALALAFIGWVLWAGRAVRPPVPLIEHLLGVAGVFLAVGLAAPILTVSARGEVALLGEIVLQHETKGVLSTIGALADSGNLATAILLGTFSVVVPLLKLVMSLLVLHAPHERLRRYTLRTIDVIGKWSMTDVFVVAVLLAFLAAKTEQLTDASVGSGLYFFAGYGILSLLAGHLMVRHEQAIVGPAPPLARSVRDGLAEAGPAGGSGGTNA